MRSLRSRGRSVPSVVPLGPSWQPDELRAFYDQLRDGARLLERVHDCQEPGPTSEAAWKAKEATRDALVTVFRLTQRCEAGARLRLLQRPAEPDPLAED